MADTISKERRSWNMSRIKSRNTKPELIVRSTLHKYGYRFRLHCKYLPGNPDLILPKFRLSIFVHGCFWHRHKNCKFAYSPKSRIQFWEKKFSDNIKRDVQVKQQLEHLGWSVLTIWECQVSDAKNIISLLSDHLCMKKT